MNATRASRLSHASLLPNLHEMKNRRSVLRTIAATSNEMEGMAGITCVGAAGGSPVSSKGSGMILILSK